MLDSLLRIFIGCRHRRLTLPMRPLSAHGIPEGQPRVVCPDCGQRFLYDMGSMRTGEAIAELR